MRERLALFGHSAVFWIGYQIVLRAIFLIYNHVQSSDLSAGEVALTFLHGLKMDASISGYFLIVTGLFLALSVYIRSRYVGYIFNSLMLLIILLSAVIAVTDAELYRHWGFRMNTTPLFYVGSEAVGSVPASVIIILITMLVCMLVPAGFIYLRCLAPRTFILKPANRSVFLTMLALSVVMIVPVRGSFTVAPMNTGFVYFHKTKTFANHAAINVVWNFFYSLRKSANVRYPEDLLDPQTTAAHFNALYPPDTTALRIFNVERPNIILFIVESFTADVIAPLGGMEEVTPEFNRLCDEGILFDNFYSSGDRTDKGLVSILSGYPAQPQTSIIKYPGKTQSLPYLTRQISRLGYRTSFVYGGDIDFANFRSYLTSCAFGHITTEDDFPSSVNESKWGVHDHIVLDRAFAECDTANSPFFKVILTLSSHEPFDVPMTSRFSGTDEASLFLNACHYTDQAIGNFIRKAKATPWWNNTLVIFVADHGHRLPFGKQAKEKERFRIPLLITGGAVTIDTTLHIVGSQTDIPATLLSQLGSAHDDFTFSKNLLSPAAVPFAAYFFNDGYGFVTPGAYLIYDNTARQFVRSDGASNELIMTSKAFQQKLYSDYNKR